jgi:hypothetical protein
MLDPLFFFCFSSHGAHFSFRELFFDWHFLVVWGKGYMLKKKGIPF